MRGPDTANHRVCVAANVRVAPSMTGVVFPQEEGWKDTVIAYPGTITAVWAKFDIAGLFVWHCHTLEHGDDEMMRPFFVVALQPTLLGRGVTDLPVTA